MKGCSASMKPLGRTRNDVQKGTFMLQLANRRVSCFIVAALTASGLIVLAGANAAHAAAPPHPGAGPGVSIGLNNEGNLYIAGPSDLVKGFCPSDLELGFTCFFSGNGETGEGVALLQGNNEARGTCSDIPLPVVSNVANDTNEPIKVGSGSCSDRGPIISGAIRPGADTNVPSGDDYDCCWDCCDPR